jgi:hypothetical protein
VWKLPAAPARAGPCNKSSCHEIKPALRGFHHGSLINHLPAKLDNLFVAKAFFEWIKTQTANTNEYEQH